MKTLLIVLAILLVGITLTSASSYPPSSIAEDQDPVIDQLNQTIDETLAVRLNGLLPR